MTENVDTTEEEVPDYLGMSDEDLEALPPIDFDAPATEDSGKETETEEVVVDENNTETVNKENIDGSKEGGSDDESVIDTAGTTESSDSNKEDAKEKVEDTEEGKKVEDASVEATTNFEEEFNKLIAPFRANNKDMQINTVDEARILMAKGANYEKKMAGLKPSLRIIKMLENNNLLDETKLNYLIDLDKKDPGAINKLMQDSGINPLDLDTENNTDYTPKSYTATNKEVELDAVLDDIRDTPAFKDTIEIVSNKWDENSRRVLVENPSIIKTINDHVSAGIYDQITTKMETERMLGRLNGVSDIDAYKQIGDQMQTAGEFKQAEQKSTITTAPQTTTTTPKKASNIAKKKAASSTVKGSKSTAKQEFNPLAMSDEEFAKLAEENFS